MNREEKFACLQLIRTPNIGPMTFSLLLQRYGSAIEALRAVPELAKRGGRSLKPASRALAKAELQANEDAGASLLFKGAGDYPARTWRLKAKSSYRALPAGLMPRRITARWPAAQWR